MPCLEVSLPKTSSELRSPIAAELTEAFCLATKHPSEIFGIRFFEYEDSAAYIGGKLCDESHPYLHMVVYCPRLKRSVKQRMGQALTEALKKASNRADWVPTIHICEHPYDNVVVGGKLLSDAYAECADRPFYYGLPQD